MADKFQIVVKKGPNPGQVIDLKDNEVTLGREPGNVLTINDKGLSRFHARLIKTDAGYTLEDLGSKNGTFVNGTVIVSPRPLQNGDQIEYWRECYIGISQSEFLPRALAMRQQK